MNQLEITITITVVVLLLIILIIYNVRKRASKKTNPEINLQSQGSAKQSQKIKPGDEPVFHAEPKSQPSGEPKADEPVFNVEPQSKHSEEVQPDEPVIETVSSKAPQTSETVMPICENKYKNLPQDSMLRRHYLTNVKAMIESLKSPRPTDSALSRHYDAMISAEMEQYLSDEAAMERLICNYEEKKKH